MPSLRDEVINLSFNFIHYKDLWQNRLNDLQKAYADGYAEFKKHLSIPHQGIPKDMAEDLAELGANMWVASLALEAGPALIAVPIVFGIKKFGGLLATEVKLPSPDVTAVKTRLDDIERAFRQATEHMSTELMKLREKAIRLPGGATYSFDADFRHIQMAISRILLSPLWFPPGRPATDPLTMARPFEMRLWFIYWKYVQDLGTGMMNLDLRPMFRRLKVLGWQPSGYDWNKVYIGDDSFLNKGKMWYEPWYRGAIKFLVAYSQQFKRLTIQHKFPKQVEEYLQRIYTPRIFTLDNPAVTDHLLSPSTMTWADVSAWRS